MRIKWSMFIALGLAIMMGLIVQLMRYEYGVMRHNVSHEIPKFETLSVKNAVIPSSVYSEKEKYLVIYDSMEPVSLELKENIKKVFQYLQKEVHFAEASSFKTPSTEYNMVIITFESLNRLQNMEYIIHYTAKGGNVFFAIRPMMDEVFESLYRKMGIQEVGTEYTTKGIHFLSNVLIQFKGEKVPGDVISNSSLFVSLDPRSKILAMTEENTPLLWEYGYKKGKIMVYNGSTLHLKVNRGLLVGAISMLSDYFIYPIMNTKLLWIDDFPAYYSNTIDKQIFQLYRLNKTRFFRNIWWLDMLKLVDQYDIRYTGALIETYNNKVKPPFTEDDGADQNNLIIYGKELINHKGELGIHGYNHQALSTDNRITGFFRYNTWKSKEDMVESLREVLRYSKKAYPNYEFKNYVPPSNVLSKEGREAVIRSLPNVNSISSLYLQDSTDRAYIQEFEMAQDGLIELPRITSGYLYDPFTRWTMINAITSLGVFSHFIHPDDVLDTERSLGKPWPDLKKEFTSIIVELNQQYSWLRSMTASGGSFELQKYVNTKWYFEPQQKSLKGYAQEFRGEVFLILRTGNKVGKCTHCQIESIDQGVYLLKVEQEKFELEWDLST